MAMTVNPDAGLRAPDSFLEEALYAFRFDLDSDGREAYNRAVPTQDLALIGGRIAALTEELTTPAGSTDIPDITRNGFWALFAHRFCPTNSECRPDKIFWQPTAARLATTSRMSC